MSLCRESIKKKIHVKKKLQDPAKIWTQDFLNPSTTTLHKSVNNSWNLAEASRQCYSGSPSSTLLSRGPGDWGVEFSRGFISHYISQHNHHYNASCLSATLHKGHEEFAYNVYIMLHLKPVISITYSDTLLIHAGMCKPGVLLTLTLGSILHMLSICMAHMLLQMSFRQLTLATYIKLKLSGCWVCNWGISVPPVQYI